MPTAASRSYAIYGPVPNTSIVIPRPEKKLITFLLIVTSKALTIPYRTFYYRFTWGQCLEQVLEVP